MDWFVHSILRYTSQFDERGVCLIDRHFDFARSLQLQQWIYHPGPGAKRPVFPDLQLSFQQTPGHTNRKKDATGLKSRVSGRRFMSSEHDRSLRRHLPPDLSVASESISPVAAKAVPAAEWFFRAGNIPTPWPHSSPLRAAARHSAGRDRRCRPAFHSRNPPGSRASETGDNDAGARNSRAQKPPPGGGSEPGPAAPATAADSGENETPAHAVPGEWPAPAPCRGCGFPTSSGSASRCRHCPNQSP